MTQKKAPPPPRVISGGPLVVDFNPNETPKKFKPKEIPIHKKAEQIQLTEKEFVKKYKNEVITASWDPAVLRKCGRGAEEILQSLGAPKKKVALPYSALQQRREKRLEDEELEGTRYFPKETHQKRHKEKRAEKKAQKHQHSKPHNN